MNDDYTPIEQYLRNLPRNQEAVTLSFESIEQILGAILPSSARRDQAWWANQRQGTQVESNAWMNAGWMVDTVDFRGQLVHFVRQ